MRRSLSLILVMLLVLRGLLGDAMAMGMAPATLPAGPSPHHVAVAAAPLVTTPFASAAAALAINPPIS